MTKITRPGKNIVAFGSNAEGTERTTFGTTTQANDLDSNLNDSFARGWGIVAGSDLPTKQDFNAMGYTLGQLNAYLYQMGIAEYDASQEYHQNSFTNYNGVIYKSLTNNNVGNTPNTSTTNWESVIDGKYLPLIGGTLSGDLTAPNITANKSLTVGSAKVTYSTVGLNFDKPLLINGAAVLKQGDYNVGNSNLSTSNVTDDLAQSSSFIGCSYTNVPASIKSSIGNTSGIVGINIPYRASSSGTKFSARFFLEVESGARDAFIQHYVNNSWIEPIKLITTSNVSSYQGLGYGQTWQDVTTQRSLNVIYQNTTGKTIFIVVSVSNAGSGVSISTIEVTIDDMPINISSGGFDNGGAFKGTTVFLPIPSGSTYTASSRGSSLRNWFELR
jgi:hypothetical protein